VRKSFITPREKTNVSKSLKIWSFLYFALVSASLTYYIILGSNNSIILKNIASLNSSIESIKHSDAIKRSNIQALNSFDELKIDYDSSTMQIISTIKKDLEIIPNRVLLELYTIKDSNTKFIGKVFKKVDYESMRRKFLERYSESTMSVKELPDSFDILTIKNKKN
jgi:hypothetical protein